jgi:protoporphyrinogen oxidase
VGGNAGSFEVGGLRVDYGSHRLHPSCRPEILADIRGMLGGELLDRPRHGRILLRGRWVHFPLNPMDLALHLPVTFALGVLRDAAVKGSRGGDGESFATVLERGLGRTICREFYFPYAEKIWGVSPDELDAEQARRRVSAGSLVKVLRKVLNSVPGLKAKGSGRFYYPKRGYGAISEAFCQAALKAGASVRLQTAVSSVAVEAGSAVAVLTSGEGGEMRFPARQILSTIPLPYLVRAITPAAPADVLESAKVLKYRAMILIYLVLDADRFTEYDAHYFPCAEVPISRLSEPKNYGLAGVPGKTVLCAELPCSPENPVWRAADHELESLLTKSLERAGLPVRVPVRSVVIRRLEQAYPIYGRDYRKHFDRVDVWLSRIEGLVTFGRQGLFVHDNTHHTLAMAYTASECLNDSGKLDGERWVIHRQAFQEHVVED